ncbi:MAG: molybdenum cofactor guanylyltransferase [Chloracidobacterium sp.]|nr:molybdenum cofactor guanylyltransferase [Chloracidobacterium sp.]
MDLDAFILIGGRSSRLGTDKAFVELGGKTLAVRSADIVETALSPNRITFVARDKDQFKPELLSSLGHSVIADQKPGFGAWSGIDAALRNAQSEWIFILACDLPFVLAELLQLLAGFAKGDSEAVVPRQADARLQPLCAFYRIKPTLAVVETIFTGQSSPPPLNAIFDGLQTHIIEPDEYAELPNAEKLFLNINTENDLSAALS